MGEGVPGWKKVVEDGEEEGFPRNEFYANEKEGEQDGTEYWRRAFRKPFSLFTLSSFFVC